MADFPIVGIGSSAGGLEALEKLFEAMPPDTGAAFVVIAHLDPTRESHLTELLRRRTKMPTVEVEGDTKVEANHVYVIAPDQDLTLRDGVLCPIKPSEPRAQRRPVDVFFRSLAESQRERAIGIVLSGTGTNGAAGLRFIKSEGGIAIAQDPATAGYGGMPQSAISTGVVDLVLAPENMAQALSTMVRHPYVRHPEAVDRPEVDGQLSALLALLRAQTDLDFRPYRRQTLLRRTHRRMGLHQIQQMSTYLERLRADPQEAAALARDLTINVSGFFRDPQAWKVLDEKVIAPLVAERERNSAIRIWVPGCATGEEAYSIAMLIAARAQEARKLFDLRIFATDVAHHLLPTARAGLYPASIAGEVGADRLELFFDPEDDSYQAKKWLRDWITFAPQNLLQDPPFSRLDLITCRNLLIYLEPDVQKKVLALFHFALREHGHLFLGPAESISGHENLFHPVSKKWRIFRRLGPTRHDIVEFPLIGSQGRTAETERDAAAPREPRRAIDPFQRALLERFAPASVLIDRRFHVHAFHGPTGDYLQQPGGEPSINLLALARDGLQAPLRSAVQRALAENQEIASAGRVKRGGSFEPVRVVARPLGRARDADPMLLVSFFERERPEPGGAPEVEESTPSSQLEGELLAAREDLRITVEQMETANEELKASNEEIRSINEELQASNEELETSKEELQSLNEELNTTNSELQAKVEELEVRTNDLNNLFNSSDVATLFLDRSLCIRWFTPSMKALLELLPSDIGRPISHFAQRFKGGDLVEDTRSVLDRLLPTDAEVVDDLGRWYIRHILPYRTEDDRIDGVVVTFTEITDRKHREKEVEQAKEFAEAIVEAVRFPLVVLSPDLRVKTANAAFYETFQVTAAETEGKPLAQLGNRQWEIPELQRRLSSVLPERAEFSDFEIDHEFERIGQRTMLLHARLLDGARLILLGMVDLTERKRGEQERELLARELSHRVKNILAVVQSIAVQTDGRSRSVEEYRDKFIGRLSALARAHSLLLDTQWRRADLRQLVEQELQAYRTDRQHVIEIDGESVPLAPSQGLGVSLIVHELVTNAAKHGALSHHEGRVRVAWWIEQSQHGRRAHLLWEESGGPKIEEPGENGFGTRLIQRACTYELEGEVELDYAPGGLRCELVFPLS